MRVLISIGVDFVTGFTRLHSAASGAYEVSKWASACGFTAFTFTDPDRLEMSGLKREVTEIVKQDGIEHLCVYFAGHGLVPSPNSELWLLRNALEDSGDAIDYVQTVFNARTLGIPHVSLISDTCRSTARNQGEQAIRGQSLFPNLKRSDRVEIDTLMSTKRGTEAFETQDYGVYTQTVLEAVKNPSKFSIPLERRDHLDLLTANHLGKFLEKEVGQRIAELDARAVQVPDHIAESHLPNHLVSFPAGVSEIPTPEPKARKHFWERIRSFQFKRQIPTFGQENYPELLYFYDSIVLSGSREFEFLGLTEGANMVVEDATIYRPKGLNHAVRRGTQIAPIPRAPEYSTEVFNQNEQFGFWFISGPRGQFFERELNFDRRVALNALQAGVFRIENHAEIADVASHVKGNPMLGILTAYAYALAGEGRQIRSLKKTMLEDLNGYLPFDIVLLDTMFSDEGPDEVQSIIGNMPILTQGWSYLLNCDSLATEEHRLLSRFLVPSIWTTFNEGCLELDSFKDLRK